MLYSLMAMAGMYMYMTVVYTVILFIFHLNMQYELTVPKTAV